MPEVSVSPVLSVNSGTHAQGLVSPNHSSNVSLTLVQLINYFNLAQLQEQCSETQELVLNSVLRVPFSGVSVLCDLFTSFPRPLVPVPLRKPLFLQLYGLSHPGVGASHRLISQHFKINFFLHRWTRYSPVYSSSLHHHLNWFFILIV